MKYHKLETKEKISKFMNSIKKFINQYKNHIENEIVLHILQDTYDYEFYNLLLIDPP